MIAYFKKLTCKSGRKKPAVKKDVTVLHTEKTPYLVVVGGDMAPMIIPLERIAKVFVDQDENSLEVIMKK